MTESLLWSKHKAFFKRCLFCFPHDYQTLDTTRLTLLFFVISGLDILGAIDEISEDERQRIIKWIYDLELTTKKGTLPKCCGFRGALVAQLDQEEFSEQHLKYESGHLAMTYSALCCLLILGDDLSRVDRLGVLAGVRACHLPNGSFCAQPGAEHDMRFVYCGAAICYILNDWRAFNTNAVVKFIRSSLNYDGGIGQGPLLESHGGSTYCAVATLKMLSEFDCSLSKKQIESLERWCFNRQGIGFHSRANKADDSCYTFWIGATLKMLAKLDLAGKESAINFTLLTQDSDIGGFGKYSDSLPDVLHSYLSLSGLALLEVEGLSPVDPLLNITSRAASRLETIRAFWPPVEAAKLSCCAES